MLQIALAIVFSFAFLFLQITHQPYLNSYHNFMSANVNMQIVVTLFASLLFKVDNEMEDSLSYEAGYDLDTVALVLIIFTSTVLVEILRYLKTAVEFMLSVVIVEVPLLGDDHVPFDLGFSKDRDVHWAITSWLRGSYDLDKERECTTARDDLEECVRQSRNFLQFLENDAVKDKIDTRVKSKLEW